MTFKLIIIGCLSLKKVKFATRLETEYINNFKIAQNAFRKVGVDKVCSLDQFSHLCIWMWSVCVGGGDFNNFEQET